MQIDVICKVIDNFGDAGFCLRLARGLITKGHAVRIYHDDPVAFQKLWPQTTENLLLIDARVHAETPQADPPPDLILEPFGTSSEQTQYRFDLMLKSAFPTTPWMLVDYLSAEDWIEEFHLKDSIDPASGHVSTYFYPGFTSKTGGLLHCDLDAEYIGMDRHNTGWHQCGANIYVFAYDGAPFAHLLDACTPSDSIWFASSSTFVPPPDHRIKVSPFVAQDQFDALLAKHDVVFVRGEDSFVRAQLLGIPFVWQIYPTADGQHIQKLLDFLALYLKDAEPNFANALREVCLCWNDPARHDRFHSAWNDLRRFNTTWDAHARQWQLKLKQGPELVSEILTWRFGLAPTLTK